MIDIANKILQNLKKDKICVELDKQHIKKAMCQYVENILMLDYSKVKTIKDSRIVDNIYNICKGLQYTPYEQALYGVCNDFNVDIKIIHINTKETCDNIYKILSNTDQKNCDMLFSLSVREHIKNNCNNYLLKISEKECIFAYNTLLKEVKKCNLDYNQYKNLLKADYTPKCINNIYKNNYQIVPSDPECILNAQGVKVSLKKDLCFTDIATKNITSSERRIEEELKYYDNI